VPEDCCASEQSSLIPLPILRTDLLSLPIQIEAAPLVAVFDEWAPRTSAHGLDSTGL
jgi:hypothetical protein